MVNANPSFGATTKTKIYHNRVKAILIHLPRYWIKGGASRLARDIGLSKSTISHMIRGRSHPLYDNAHQVVKCLERELGFPLDHEEVFSNDGTYPTPFVCVLVGCHRPYGCLPEICSDPPTSQNPFYRQVEKGHWTGDNFEFENISETLSYDYESRVTGITYPSTATNSFTYNALDARASKVDSAGTSTYKRDGADVTDFVLSDGAAGYTTGVSERRSGTTKFYHQDQLGTVTRLTNTSQTSTDTKLNDAFGVLVSSTGSTPTPFGFVGCEGYQEDADSGLKLLGHRYYDPSEGRFLTRDAAMDGRNWYTYCDNNPLGEVDPDGSIAWFLGVLYVIPGVGEVALAVTAVVVVGAAVYEGAQLYDNLSEMARHRKGRPSTSDKHTKPRSGRSNTKNRLSPEWNKVEPKGEPTQNPGGPDKAPVVPPHLKREE